MNWLVWAAFSGIVGGDTIDTRRLEAGVGRDKVESVNSSEYWTCLLRSEQLLRPNVLRGLSAQHMKTDLPRLRPLVQLSIHRYIYNPISIHF